MSENGNGQVNGNGNGKAFVLSPPKSPEQIARDEVLATMPKLRHECSRDPRLKKSVGAKWLFGQLTDNSFMNKYGGDGWGKVYVSLKDLRRMYGHDEDTLGGWRDKLVETGWIWFQDRWPKSCWGITAVCRQPELFSPHSDYVRVMAKASGQTHPQDTVSPEAGDQPKVTAPPIGNGKTAIYGQNDRHLRSDQPKPSAIPAETDGLTSRSLRPYQPKPAVCVGGEVRSDQPKPSAIMAETDGCTHPNSPVRPAEGHGHIRETPGSKGGFGAIGGGHPPPPDVEFENWFKGLEGMFPSKLRKLEAQLKERLARARCDEARHEWKRRLAAVEERLLGGRVPDAPPPARPVQAPPKPKDPTPEEILEGARYLVSIGKSGSLTKAQKAALAKEEAVG